MRKEIWFLLFFLLPLTAQAAPCWKRIFEWNEKTEPRKNTILILPFENASALEQDEWISHLFPIILQDYLSHTQKLTSYVSVQPSTSLFDPEKGLELAEKGGINFLIIGQFSRTGSVLHVSTRFLDVRSRSEVGRLAGEVEFPGTRKINDFLIELAIRASDALGTGRLKKNKLQPYRNETVSGDALRFYTLGVVALKRGTLLGVREAIRRFEESIRQDYNYAPAYLGLSLALVRQGFIDSQSGLSYRDSLARARGELEKGRMLRGALAKLWEQKIEPYLIADTHLQLAWKHEGEGRPKKAIDELGELLKGLPGDQARRGKISQMLEDQGRKKEAERHQEIFNQLNQCTEEE